MKNVIGFYHSADLDGMCSGAIIKYIFNDAKLIPFNYGYSIDWSLIDKDSIVIMSDVSASKEDMIKLKETSDRFIWIDHHITKINELKDITFEGLQVDGTAACELTWKFFMQTKIPFIVQMLGSYDVWKLSPEVLSIQYGMRQYDCDPNNQDFWKSILEEDPIISDIMSKGTTIYKYVKQSDKVGVTSIGFITKFRNFKVLAVNRSHVSSLFFDDHPERDNVDILMTFCWNGSSWKISMYSQKDINVSEICYEFGGGGHFNAAGFTVTRLPFEIGKTLFGGLSSK